MLRCVDNDQTGQNDWPNRSGKRQALANPDCAVQPALDKVAQRPEMPAPARHLTRRPMHTAVLPSLRPPVPGKLHIAGALTQGPLPASARLPGSAQAGEPWQP